MPRERPEWADWLVNHERANMRPHRLDHPVPVEVRSDLYDGTTAVVTGQVTHAAEGLVCVEQDTPTGHTWAAWVPTDRVRRTGRAAERLGAELEPNPVD